MRSTWLNPKAPERICWGCEKFCPAHDLACGNGTIRTPHPAELFGPDWLEWSEARSDEPASGSAPGSAAAAEAETGEPRC